MLIRSLAPMTRPLIFEPRPARAELTRPIDMPAAPAVLRKSLRPTGPLFSDICPSRVGIFVNLSVALSGGWGLGGQTGAGGPGYLRGGLGCVALHPNPLFMFERLRQVVSSLHPDPCVRCASECFRETNRHFR